MNTRVVLPELLDVLPPRDAAALRSRRDLRRLNAWMNHPRIMARTLQETIPGGNAHQFAELGAGDGHFLLNVAGRVNGCWPGSRAILVDRLNVLAPETLERFQQRHWHAKGVISSAAEWLRRNRETISQTIISNLFFHQFKTDELSELLQLASASASLVVALEPRRAWLPRLCGRLLWAIGCGPVTRHDAHISIRAGFIGRELTELWPDKEHWSLTEQPAGMFSHLFIAQREK